MISGLVGRKSLHPKHLTPRKGNLATPVRSGTRTPDSRGTVGKDAAHLQDPAEIFLQATVEERIASIQNTQDLGTSRSSESRRAREGGEVIRWEEATRTLRKRMEEFIGPLGQDANQDDVSTLNAIGIAACSKIRRLQESPRANRHRAIINDLQEKSDLLASQNEDLRRQNEDLNTYVLELEKATSPTQASLAQMGTVLEELRDKLQVTQKQRRDIQATYKRECEELKLSLKEKCMEVETMRGTQDEKSFATYTAQVKEKEASLLRAQKEIATLQRALEDGRTEYRYAGTGDVEESELEVCKRELREARCEMDCIKRGGANGTEEIERQLAACETRVRVACAEERRASESSLRREHDDALAISASRFKVELQQVRASEERIRAELAEAKLALEEQERFRDGETSSALATALEDSKAALADEVDRRKVLEGVLGRQEASLAAAADQRGTLEVKVAKQEAALAATEEQLARAEAQVDVVERRSAELEGLLADKEARIAATETERGTFAAAAARHEGALASIEEQCEALRASLASKGAALAATEEQRVALEVTVAKQEAALAIAGATQQTALAKKESAFVEVTAAHRALEDTLDKREAALEEARLHSEQLQCELRQREELLRQHNLTADSFRAELEQCREKRAKLDQEQQRYDEAMAELAETKDTYDTKFSEAMELCAEDKKRCNRKFQDAMQELESERREVENAQSELERDRSALSKQVESAEHDREEIERRRAAVSAAERTVEEARTELGCSKRSLKEERLEWQREQAEKSTEHTRVLAERNDAVEDLGQTRKQWHKERAQWQRQRASLEAKLKQRCEKREEKEEIEEVMEAKRQLQKERAAMMSEVGRERADMMSFQGQAIAMALKDQEQRIEKAHEEKMEEFASQMRSRMSTPVSSSGMDSAREHGNNRWPNSARGYARGSPSSRRSPSSRGTLRIDIDTDIDDSCATSTVSMDSSRTTGSSAMKSCTSQSSRTSAYRPGSPLSVLNAQRVPTPNRSHPLMSPAKNSVNWEGPPTLRPKGLGGGAGKENVSLTQHAQNILNCVNKGKRQRSIERQRLAT